MYADLPANDPKNPGNGFTRRWRRTGSQVAAITAARQGISVTLVERYGFLGGASTTVLDTFCGFYLREGGRSHKIVGGIPDLVIDELKQRRAALVRPSSYWKAGDVITYHPEMLKIVWETLAVKAGVRLLYHTFCRRCPFGR